MKKDINWMIKNGKTWASLTGDELVEVRENKGTMLSGEFNAMVAEINNRLVNGGGGSELLRRCYSVLRLLDPDSNDEIVPLADDLEIYLYGKTH